MRNLVGSSEYILPLIAVLSYFAVKVIWNGEAALLISIMFPYYAYIQYWGVGILVGLMMLLLLEKKGWRYFFLFWIANVWCAIYRLDIGYPFLLSSTVVMIMYFIRVKDIKSIFRLGTTLCIVVFTGLIFWFTLSYTRGINPLERIREFLSISQSNQNWAYADIGNSEIAAFSWFYLFLPIIVCGALIVLAFTKDVYANKKDIWIFLFLLGFAYLFNFSRGIVRHSLVEIGTTNSVLVWSSYFFLSGIVATLSKRRRLFLPVFSTLVFLDTMFIQTGVFNTEVIVNMAAVKTGQSISSWSNNLSVASDVSKTYWEKLKEEKQIVKRVEWEDIAEKRVRPYAYIMGLLLDEDETYVDFTCNGFIYSAIGKENPVYVTQSPSMLSGEFSQNKFIEQLNEKVEKVPLVIMPLNSDRLNIYIDGIPSAYKYYLVSEYIYQNYRPLCKYEDEFAIWCTFDRYEEMRDILNRRHYDFNNDLLKDNLLLHNCAISIDQETSEISVTAKDSDPYIYDLNDNELLKQYEGLNYHIRIEYDTQSEGYLQLYYTTEKEEKYSEEKSILTIINDDGIADFFVPVTQYTRLRLDIPEGSDMAIKSFEGYPNYEYIEYGYDGPVMIENEWGNAVEYKASGLHQYSLRELPRIWAETDVRDAVHNSILSELSGADNGLFVFGESLDGRKVKGNYLLLSAEFQGEDRGRYVQTDDETTFIVIRVGEYDGDVFREKYMYSLELEEGHHDNLIRISSDYYWYHSKINAIKIDPNQLENIEFRILGGD